MVRVLTLSLVLAGATLFGSSTTAATTPATLLGSVGKGGSYTISLRNASGKVVRRVKPGRYTLSVYDYSKIHNFHFRGPGFEFRTKLPFVGRQSWSPVTLRKGTYNFWCDPHRSKMHGSLTVAS